MSTPPPAQLTKLDYLPLAGFCLVVFGIALVSDRPLSMHEAVLPETAREMFADHDWVVPKKGGTPWLENPPLPQWVTVALAAPFGRCDTLWIVRLGPVLVGTAVVLLTAWMANRWFGRTQGLLSGYIMATLCQFTRYAWLSEDEIFLCGLVTFAVALFVALEFPRDARCDDAGAFPRSFVGRRSWLVLTAFAALGLTNLAKGLVFGTAMVLIPIAGFLFWNADLRRINRYVWLWGWLAFLGIAAAWPICAYLRYPDVLELWKFDLGARVDGGYASVVEPIWYYPLNLLWMLAPWTLVVPFGLWITRRAALVERYSPQRFLWCWALLVPAVFSIPQGKHHHYLLHALVPWAMIASFGLVWVREQMRAWPNWLIHPATSLATTSLPAVLVLLLLRDKVPGPGWIPLAVAAAIPPLVVGLNWALLHRSPRFAAQTLFGCLAAVYCSIHLFAGAYADKHRFDVAFVKRVRAEIPAAETLLDMNVGAHRGFLCLFYLDEQTTPLHNLSFLQDARLRRDTFFLLTRFDAESQLDEYGEAELVMQSVQTGGERSRDERLSLFRVRLDPHLARRPAAGVRISPMQAMYRADGPYLR